MIDWSDLELNKIIKQKQLFENMPEDFYVYFETLCSLGTFNECVVGKLQICTI